jgi:cytoskeletal protein CcmA (bactofilin family)
MTMGRYTLSRHPVRWLVVALVLGLSVNPLLAADLRAGDQVVIGPDQVVDDNLYVSASSLRIDGLVKGDVIVAANSVTVNGIIEGDLLAAAGTVIINGQLADARLAAGAAMLGPQASLSGDLMAGSGSLELQRGSQVGADLLVGAGQVLLDGAIARNVVGGAGRMQVGGVVDGNMDVAVGGTADQLIMAPMSGDSTVVVPQVPPGLTIDNAAQIKGALRYRSSTPATINSAAQIGDVSATIAPADVAASDTQATASPLWGWLRHLAALAVIGLLLIWLAPSWTRRMADQIQAAPLPTLGWGVVAAAAWMLAVFIVLLTMFAVAALVGALTLGRLVALVISLGLLVDTLLTAGLLIYVSFIAEAVVALLVGRLLLDRLMPAWNERPAIPLLLGLILYVALSALPQVGWLAGLSVALLGLGALWVWGSSLLSRGQATPPLSAAAGVV